MTERQLEAALDERDRDARDVDTNPPPLQPLGRDDGRATAAEGIEDEVALVRAGLEDPLKKSLGLLRRVTLSLLRLGVHGGDVGPDRSHRASLLLVEVALQLRPL